MTNNQNWFEQEFPKETNEIDFQDEDFEGELIIENYSNLEKLYLQNIENIDQITLKNLPCLENVTIWACDLQEIIIENCPQIKKLNVRRNLLKNLDFLSSLNLENLEKLEVDGNEKLVETIKELASKNKELKDSKNKLKTSIEKNVIFLLKKELDKINKQIEKGGDISNNLGTDELTEIAGQVVKNLKEIKDNLESELSESKTEIQQLEVKLKEKQDDDFKKQESQINYLEARINELTNLIESRKEKIVGVFTRLLPDKKEEIELIQSLVMAHLDYTKAKKQNIPSVPLRRKRDDIRNQLEDLLGETLVEEIESSLNDCEDLVIWEIELKERLQGKNLLIEQQKESLKQLTYNQGESQKIVEIHEQTHRHQIQRGNTVLRMEIVKLKTERDNKEEENKWLREQITKPTYQISQISQLSIGNQTTFTNQVTNNYYQQIISEIENQITQSLIGQAITPQDQKIINQTIIYLGTQEIFLNYRQELINNLITSYYQLAKKNTFTKWAQRTTKLMNISSKLVGSVPGGNIAQSPLGSLGTIINLAQATLQEKDFKKYLKKLETIFTEDKNALTLFDEGYRSLIGSIQFNNSSETIKNIINILQLDHTQLTPFSNNHNIYKLGGKHEAFFSNSNINLEELKIFLENLEQKLSENQQEFQSQRKELAQQTWFKTIDQNSDLLQEMKQLENQVVQLDIHK